MSQQPPYSPGNPFPYLPHSAPIAPHLPNAFHPAGAPGHGSQAFAFQAPVPAPPGPSAHVYPRLQSQRPHHETYPGSGVWQPISIRAHSPSGDPSAFSVATDIPWVDFHSRCSAKMDRPAETTILCLHHSRAKSNARVQILNSEEFGHFMREVAQMASTARSVPVTVDVWSRDHDANVAQAQASPSKGKKRTRGDDIPERELTKQEEESADLFNRIKDRVMCERHSKGSNDRYCIVTQNNGKQDKHMQISLAFIGKWAHACMEGKADEWNPPSCRRLDKMTKTRTAASDNDDSDSVQSEPETGHIDSEGDEIESAREPEPGADSDSELWAVSGHAESSTQAPTSTPNPVTACSSLFSVMPKATPANILAIYLPISDALEALHAAKPNHQFPHFAGAFQAAGYHYIDEVAGVPPTHLVEEIEGLTLPAARELQTFARAQMQYQAALN